MYKELEQQNETKHQRDKYFNWLFHSKAGYFIGNVNLANLISKMKRVNIPLPSL